TARFVDHVVWNESSLMRLLDAPFSFMNKTLASAFGATGPVGATFERVNLRTDQRRGLLTQPAFLSAMAGAELSSPIHRGKFVYENLLCGVAPTPPPDIPPPAQPVRPTTTRARFEQHDASPACAGCHQLMDPIGF